MRSSPEVRITKSGSCDPVVYKYFSNRQLISISSGTMTLSKYIPGMEEYFENGKNIVWFNTEQECMQLIDFYLKNDDLREEIGKNGEKEIIKSHTYLERVKELSYRIGFSNID